MTKQFFCLSGLEMNVPNVQEKAIRISESSDDFLPDLAIYQIMLISRIAEEVFRHVKAMQYGCPQDALTSRHKGRESWAKVSLQPKLSESLVYSEIREKRKKRP